VDTKSSQEAKEIGTHRFGSKRLDYIFVDPNYFSVLEAGLAPEQHRSASDHIGYFACVRPRPKEHGVNIPDERGELPPLLGATGAVE